MDEIEEDDDDERGVTVVSKAGARRQARQKAAAATPKDDALAVLAPGEGGNCAIKTLSECTFSLPLRVKSSGNVADGLLACGHSPER